MEAVDEIAGGDSSGLRARTNAERKIIARRLRWGVEAVDEIASGDTTVCARERTPKGKASHGGHGGHGGGIAVGG
jgi:hypothetical protein